MWSKLLPEATTVGLLLVAASGLGPYWLLGSVHEMLFLLPLVEGATLMLMWTLVDLATRLAAPPPWWLGVLILAGLLLFYPDTLSMLRLAWDMGVWVFLPVAWSVLERLRELWTLPRASPLEKYRRRALSAGRLFGGLILGGGFTLMLLVHAIVTAQTIVFSTELIDRLLVWVLIAFYGLAAFDAWRVHQACFERKPRQLWRFAHDDTAQLDPL